MRCVHVGGAYWIVPVKFLVNGRWVIFKQRSPYKKFGCWQDVFKDNGWIDEEDILTGKEALRS